MPISPANMALYPGGSIKSPEWLAIRDRIQKRANNCCEGCGVANGEIGFRTLTGKFIKLVDLDVEYPNLMIGEKVGYPDMVKGAIGRVESKVIMIVCTVAHVDQQLVDHSDENLRFWCQRCHNKHDAPSRQKNAQATRKAKVGQGELL